MGGAKKPDPKALAKGGKAGAKPKKEGSGGKAKKKKWSKGKVRDKLNNLILFDKATYDKLYKEVPSYKLITPSVVSERLKVRGSLAKLALRELHAKGLITLVSKHSSQMIYTRAIKANDDDKAEEGKKPAKAEKAPKGKKAKKEAEAAAAEAEA